MHIETLAIHAANPPDPVTGAAAPGIHLATTFARGEGGELAGDFSYSRAANPNRAALEAALAALEGGAAAFAYASGIAAIAAVLQTVGPGDHVIAPLDIYHGTRTLLKEFSRSGVRASFLDLGDPETLKAALLPETRLIFVETPSNPALQITDIVRVVEIASAAGARVAVDNTWATPVLQRPLELGADYALHSSTKYFGGHSDVVGGALVCREGDATAARIRELQWTMGAVPSPFDCWLIRRGLMTLPLRVRQQSANAGAVAAFLAGHDRVARVFYPGLADHPGHATAARQMAGFGGMLSFRVKGGEPAAAAVVARVRLFTRATSLGGVESLIEHRYRAEGPDTPTSPDLIRLSIGLEHIEDLLDDLGAALSF
ncbi:MAG TPA: PLP-dependent transferase [Anaerolineales bacterium]|nr:PLP-dependent transferase [Anaerolineales bacterium]